MVNVDGSGRLTKRNRRFLRAFSPASVVIHNAPWSSTPTNVVLGEKNLPSADKDTHDSEAAAPVPVIPEPIWDQTSDETADIPQVDPVEPLPSEAHDPPQNEPAKVPAMLKRPFPCNSLGKNEAVVTPEDGGRRSRRRGAMNL